MNLTNRMRKQVILWMAGSLAGAFGLTLIIAFALRSPSPEAGKLDSISVPESVVVARLIDQSTPAVPVFLSKEKRVDQIPIEAYVRGVIAAEMPIDFELEALKAQALAARTYIVRRMLDQDTSQVPVPGAIVTDTVSHQAYITEAQLNLKWSGKDAAANMEKLNRAVTETRGQIILYQGKPINAVFFSTSNGYTENSEDYWGEAVPYLRSVTSPWDAKLSPHAKETIKLPYKTFLSKLGLTGTVSASAAVSGTKTVKTTAGHRIGKISIGGKVFTGREVREKLGLYSSQFQWKLKGTDVEITTYGYGHGVGMSQWGANGMAKQGKTAAEIIQHYYTGVQIGNTNDTSKY
ncbi:MAG: stage sporulation protein [Paenibacillaceae bacterium]|jgi:stage II sporulation protein D|nr:stage sporulation protein [Paenibacillaceae bacterium]